jgi:hypothetical protein
MRESELNKVVVGGVPCYGSGPGSECREFELYDFDGGVSGSS